MKSEMFSVLKRRFKKHFPKTPWEEVDEYFKFSEKDNFFCTYCGKELKAIDKYPYPDVISVDHKQPLSQGGKDCFDNIAICCCQCNIVKGTMDEKTFRKMHKLLDADKEAKEKIFSGLFWGRLANKIKREKIKKEPKEKKVMLYKFV